VDARPYRERVESALARLRLLGERVTPARRAVLSVVAAADEADEHLSAEAIGERVAGLEPSVHRATVYRTLASLTTAGVLTHVHLGGTGTVYHLTALDGAVGAEGGPGTEPDVGAPRSALGGSAPGGSAVGSAHGEGRNEHQRHGHTHVQCMVCGRVQDAPPGVLDEAERRLRDELGFHLDTTHAALLGRCADCAGPT